MFPLEVLGPVGPRLLGGGPSGSSGLVVVVLLLIFLFVLLLIIIVPKNPKCFQNSNAQAHILHWCAFADEQTRLF